MARKAPARRSKTRDTAGPDLELPKVNTSSIAKSALSRARSLGPKSYTQILIALLILAAFLLGVLYTKVQYLEKNGSGTITANPTDQTGEQTPPAKKVDVETGHLPSLGNKNAKVVMVEFSDFECPFCKQYFDETFAKVKKDYVDSGKVVVYYRHFPLDFHPAAKPAALASECANEQNKFWDFHDLVFTNQADITSKTAEEVIIALKGFATTLGLNQQQFDNCLDSEKYKNNVEKDAADGSTAGVSGTPTFYINGIPVVGALPYETFKTELDKALK
jgi:protein-disulfide isomerase